VALARRVSIISEQVTVLNQTPSAFYQLSKVDEHASLSKQLNLRLVIFGGEALDLPSLKPWFDRHGDQHPQLVNMYGITETTVHVTYRPLSLADVNATGSPIGVPIPDLQIYLLDQYQQPVPMGVRGEMYVGGGGVSQGYLNRADLTSDRFIPNPFNHSNLNIQNSKLYKTGDLARYLPSGELAYLGRIDHQVKIRGFRIELGEIEAVLSQYPVVRESIVLVREDEPDNKRLIAYIVPDHQQTSPIFKLANLKEQGRLTEQSLYELPNGMVITHLNKSESEFLYQEIFEAKSYLQHGIEINQGDCIFDVGANIGLFTLFAAQMRPNVEVYAFEPIPPVFECLRLNTELYDLKVKLFNSGLSSETKRDKFTYYPKVSVISGRFADAVEEKEVVKSFLLNQEASAINRATLSKEMLDELLEERLQSEQFTCELKTLSDIIHEHQVEQINLLKIDVEKSERDVLAGIQESDWQKIKQIIVEVHDINGRLTEITNLLKRHGYDLTVIQDRLLEKTPLYNIYARRVTAKLCPTQKNDDDQLYFSGKPIWSSLNQFIKDIRDYLKQKLPEYMVPNAFVALESFPITPNGKIDRRALPAPNSFYGELETCFIPPRTPMEVAIASIWSEVLCLDKISINDNFFALGGQSFLATQIISRIRNAFSIELPLSHIFESPTVEELSKVVDLHSSASERQNELEFGLTIPSLVPVTNSTEYPLSCMQQCIWDSQQKYSDSYAYNSSLIVSFTGTLSAKVLEQCINEVICRHEVLRTNFKYVGNQVFQVVNPSFRLNLKLIDVQDLALPIREAEIEKLVANEIQQFFDLFAAPPIKAVLLRLASDNHLLIIVMHHIITDGWSINILYQELQSLYHSFLKGQPSPLPQPPFQYRDFIFWEQQVSRERIMEKQLSYWRKKLENAAPPCVPTPDHLDNRQNERKAAFHQLVLSPNLFSSIKALSLKQEVTIFVAILTAIKIVLFKWTGQTDIVVSGVVNNRNQSELEQMLGCFINQVPLRTLVSNHQTGLALLKQIQQTVNEALSNQLVSIHKIDEIVKPYWGQTSSRIEINMLNFSSKLNSDWEYGNLRGQQKVETSYINRVWDKNLFLEFNIFPYPVEATETFLIRVRYNSDLFAEETISNLVICCEKVLHELASKPDDELINYLK